VTDENQPDDDDSSSESSEESTTKAAPGKLTQKEGTHASGSVTGATSVHSQPLTSHTSVKQAIPTSSTYIECFIFMEDLNV
jgi:hypothetical protein